MGVLEKVTKTTSLHPYANLNTLKAETSQLTRRIIPKNREVRLFNTLIIPWNPEMVYYESDLLINVTLGRLLGSGCFIACTVMLLAYFNWYVTVMVFIFLLINLTTMGLMFYWNVKLSFLSILSLLSSFCISVPLSTAIVHAFAKNGKKRCWDKPHLKTIDALIITGYPTIHGTAASLLGISVVLISAPSNFISVFSKITILVSLSVCRNTSVCIL